ncbi:MAG TPA: FlgD immunoglobulin-like domain containing protein, partial [Candidatus Krumholzibacteria bacterium]|nr:FlgD immunoglobulin-like domain containing protein [Candidatus Krumholzibacteria bacterium]
PNPFNPTTEIAFRTAVAGPVRVTVHDAAGRLVRVLSEELRAAGSHAVRWDGRDAAGMPAASGVYLVRVAGPRVVDRGKITLVK